MESSIESPRELAIKRIKTKSDFKTHLVAYLAVNAMSVIVWVFTAAWFPYPLSFFWPIFPIAGWGVGIVIHAYSVYRGNVYTEEQIQREMKALS